LSQINFLGNRLKITISLIALFASTHLMAEYQGAPYKCGEYKVAGIVRMKNNEIKVVVNEKTVSEQIISFDKYDLPRLTPFFDKPLTLSVRLLTKWDGTKGKATEIIGSPADRVPDPLKPNDTGFELQKELPCQK
jgi:hypothetical protein